MKRLLRIGRLFAFLTTGFIFFIFFFTSLPTASSPTHELIKLFLFGLFIIVCPVDLGKPTGKRHFTIDVLTALTLAVVWHIGFIILYSLAFDIPTLVEIFLSILTMCALLLLSLLLHHKPSLLLFLATLFASQLCFILIFSGPIFASLSLLVAVFCAFLWSVSNRLALLKAFGSLFLGAALFFIYYVMNLDIKLVVPAAILLIASGLVILGNKWHASSRVMKFATFAVTLGMVFSLFSIFSFACWLPGPVQSLIVSSQKGVEVLLHPRKMPAGIRIFIPQEEGWLVALYDANLYKWGVNIDIAMIDKAGNIIRTPFQTGTRLDRIVCPVSLQDICFVLGLESKLICALDVDNWRIIACSEEEGYWGHLAVSPDGEFAAVYGDEAESRLKAYYFGDTLRKYRENQIGDESLSALSVSKSLSECCAGNAIRFIENRRLVVHDHYKHVLYIIDVDEQRLRLKDKIEDYGKFNPLIFKMVLSKDAKKILVPIPLDWEAEEVLPSGAIEVVNLQEKKVDKNISSPLMLGLRRLVSIPELDAYCGASEFGLLFIFDKDLEIKKILYAGSHIRYIYVKGSELYFASQAGLVKVNLEDVEL